MTKVTVSTWVKVKDGPSLSMSNEVQSETVAQATLELDAAGGSAAEQTADLLAGGGKAVLLALSAQTADGRPADIGVTPSNGSATGDVLTVSGALTVADPGVLDALVAGGPRALKLTNAGPEPVTVKIIAARAD